jgi:ribosomal protein L37AE/L43A
MGNEHPIHRNEERQKAPEAGAVGSGALHCPLCRVPMTRASGLVDDVGRCASCGRYYRREHSGDYTALPHPPGAVSWLAAPKPAVASAPSAEPAQQRRSSLLREGAEKPCECGSRLVFLHANGRWQCSQCGAVEEAFI